VKILNQPLPGHNPSHIDVIGNISQIAYPESIADIQSAFAYAQDNRLLTYILGAGSNTLIGSAKRTLIISDMLLDKSIEYHADEVVASSGIKINDFIKGVSTKCYCGLEFLYGIPAHIGGAIYMNAGAYEKSISDYINWIDVVTVDAELRYNREDIHWGYRKIVVDGMITRVGFSLEKFDDPGTFSYTLKNFVEKRNSSHPMNMPSLGCFFKNPDSISAGMLIDKAGLKGYRIGDAMVSEKHGNFLVNVGSATFDDFENLINVVKKVVFETHNITLELEIRIINE
jgi:UDP-N-acetylmuramate dehydrogenase